MVKRLSDKIALISGGGTGIGKAISELFFYEGAKLFILGRKEESLREVCKKKEADYSCCDISKAEQVKDSVNNALKKYGKIDILVNNAGIHLIEGPLISSDENIIDKILNTNVKGTLLLSKYVLRAMVQNEKGSIINISSILGIIGAENTCAYTASKGAIISATRSIAMEYANKGVRVNSISPSLTETEMMKKLFMDNPDLEQRLLSAHPMRKFISPQDVAQTALFLASDESRYLTGQNIILDGERSIYDR
jgi:NAD(P)-dependent dehydrogenase (short-subunit alcohol dehydrogenase family)